MFCNEREDCTEAWKRRESQGVGAYWVFVILHQLQLSGIHGWVGPGGGFMPVSIQIKPHQGTSAKRKSVRSLCAAGIGKLTYSYQDKHHPDSAWELDIIYIKFW